MDYMKDYKNIAEKFVLCGEVKSIEPYGEGHINLTLLVTTDKKRYIMQKMNTRVFKDPVSLMNSICGVTEHLNARGVESLRVVPTKNGAQFLQGDECYRVYDFIENTVTYQTASNKEVFKNSGKAFGEFQNYLAEFDASKLAETIKEKKGICFDYAALMAAMLRSQRIPTKLEFGYAGDAYHAWVTTYIEDEGWINGIIKFDGVDWTLMDPTFAANAGTKKIKSFIGDGNNYTTKYTY